MTYDTAKKQTGRKPVSVVELLLDACRFEYGQSYTNLAPDSEDRTAWTVVGFSDQADGLLSNGLAGLEFTADASELFAVYDVTNATWITTETAYSQASRSTTQRQEHTFTTPAGCTSVRIYPARKDGSNYVYDTISGLTAGAVYTASFYHEKAGALQKVGGLQLVSGTAAGHYVETAGASATAGCSASGGSGSECYNTRKTCQSAAEYTKILKSYRFSDIPIVSEPVIPSLDSISMAPTRLDPTKGLGQRANLSLTFTDHPHSDVGVDPYYATRSYDPLTQGTYWGKLLARNPYYYSRRVRVTTGYLDTNERFDPDAVLEREYIIDTISGPDSQGRVKLTAKDVLKLADDKSAQCPAPSEGGLSASVTAAATSFSVAAGQGAGYASSGRLRINDELIDYTTLTTDTFSGLTRGVGGTTATDHGVDDLVQQCYVASADNVVDVIEDLLTNYANVPAQYIPSTDWATEKTDWLGSYDLDRTISEPTGVNELLGEIAIECNLNLWWCECEKEIKLEAIVPPRYTPPVIGDEFELLADSVRVRDIEADRISQLWFYFAKRNQLEDGTENYRFLYVKADAGTEGADQYNKKRVRVIKSQWFGDTDLAVAKTTANRMLGRYLYTPKEVTFELDGKDADYRTGDLITLSTRAIQDTDGSNKEYSLVIVSTEETIPGTRWRYVAVTSQWSGEKGCYIGPASLTNDYTSATDSEKANYGFITKPDGTMSNGDPGYVII